MDDERMTRNHSEAVELPKCRECGRTLEIVYENQYWTFSFNDETGKYEGTLLTLKCDVLFAIGISRKNSQKGYVVFQ
jgi:hypothetical protein